MWSKLWISLRSLRENLKLDHFVNIFDGHFCYWMLYCSLLVDINWNLIWFSITSPHLRYAHFAEWKSHLTTLKVNVIIRYLFVKFLHAKVNGITCWKKCQAEETSKLLQILNLDLILKMIVCDMQLVSRLRQQTKLENRVTLNSCQEMQKFIGDEVYNQADNYH